MAQFRVEFVLDQATGKYLAEMYHPDNASELLVRTEALYPSQEAAVLGVVQLFKNAIVRKPKPKAKAKANTRAGKKGATVRAQKARRPKKRK